MMKMNFGWRGLAQDWIKVGALINLKVSVLICLDFLYERKSEEYNIENCISKSLVLLKIFQFKFRYF